MSPAVAAGPRMGCEPSTGARTRSEPPLSGGMTASKKCVVPCPVYRPWRSNLLTDPTPETLSPGFEIVEHTPGKARCPRPGLGNGPALPEPSGLGTADPVEPGPGSGGEGECRLGKRPGFSGTVAGPGLAEDAEAGQRAGWRPCRAGGGARIPGNRFVRRGGGTGWRGGPRALDAGRGRCTVHLNSCAYEQPF